MFGNGIMNGTKPWPDVIKQSDEPQEETIHRNVYVHYMKKMSMPLCVLESAALGVSHPYIRKTFPESVSIISVQADNEEVETSIQRQLAKLVVRKVFSAAINKTLSMLQLAFISPTTAYVIDNRICTKFAEFSQSDRFTALNPNLQQYALRYIKQHQSINTMLHHLLYFSIMPVTHAEHRAELSKYPDILSALLIASREQLLFAVKVLTRIAEHPEKFINSSDRPALHFDVMYMSLEDACGAQERIHALLEKYVAQLVNVELLRQYDSTDDDAPVALRDEREGVAHPTATKYLGTALSLSCLKDVVLRLDEIDHDNIIEERELQIANSKRKPIRTEARTFKPRVGTRFSIHKKPNSVESS